MITKRIKYSEYARKDGINRSLETVKNSYDADTKTIEVMVGDAYDDELDEIIMAYVSKEAFYAACVDDATDEEKEEGWNDRYNWFHEAFGWNESETDAILNVLR